MQFFQEKRKQIVILVLCAALLTAGGGLTKRFLRHLEGGDSPVVDCEVAPAGMDVETHQLLLGVTVTLKEWQTPGLLVEAGDTSMEFPLTETADGVFSGSVAVPLDPLNGLRLYLTEETAENASTREPLGSWANATMLLPVRLQKYQLTNPRFEAGELRNGVVTTQAEDIHLEGGEDGSCAVELRVYRNGTFAEAAPGTWDADSGLYHTERLEVPCKLEDNLRLTIAYRDAQNTEYENTIGRWEITAAGDVREEPDLKQDINPTLTWPQEGEKTTQA